MGRYREPLDQNWLTEQYSEQKLSMTEIAEKASCSPTFVRTHLLQYGIPIRDKSEAHRLHREEDGFVPDPSVLAGCLLGDASLIMGNKSSNICVPYFRKYNINRDHVELVSSLLFSGRMDRVKEIVRKDPSPTASPVIYSIASLSYECLSPIYKEWYPADNGYVKGIPESVEVDEVMLLHWFLDDGTSQVIERKRGRRMIVFFCSECFLRDDQEMLCEKINWKYDLGATTVIHNKGTAFRISIPQTKAASFFEIIGPSPITSMSYKWKLDGHIWDDGRPYYKLTSNDVREVKRLLAEGHTQTSIADKFGLNQTTVSCINTGKTWSHVSLDHVEEGA